MFESYWQLACNPFDNDADQRFFFRSDTHQGALLKLRYLIENRKGAGLLVGGTGFGKTFIIEALAQQMSESHGPFVHIVFPQLSPEELLAYLAVELGADANQVGSEAGGLDRTIREIEGLLAKYGDQGRHPVIVVDEAHLIEDMRVFQALRLLLNFQQHSRTCFSLILSGQPELLSRIRRMAQFEERLGVKCLLRPLTHEETVSYISWRLQAAGATKPIFESQAVTTLFELSGGVPRRINRLCDMSLLVGYADESSSICSEQVEAVSEELTTVSPD